MVGVKQQHHAIKVINWVPLSYYAHNITMQCVQITLVLISEVAMNAHLIKIVVGVKLNNFAQKAIKILI